MKAVDKFSRRPLPPALLLILVWLVAPGPGRAVAATSLVDLVYPRVSSGTGALLVPDVDSMFVLGHLAGKSRTLTLNGNPVPLTAGRFLHFFPRPRDGRLVFRSGGGADFREQVFLLENPPPSPPLPAPDPLPRFVRTIRPDCSLKCAVDGTYSLFPDSGQVLEVSGFENGLYGVRIGEDRRAWIRASCVEAVEEKPVVPAVLYSCTLKAEEEGWQLAFNAPRQLLEVRLENEERKMVLQLDNAVSNLDRVIYADGLEKWLAVDWRQLTGRELELTIWLLRDRVFGYYWEQDGERTVLHVRMAGHFRALPRRNWKIILDPGHGGSATGARGPGGLTEKEVNLQVARVLARRLQRRGFQVSLTRTRDEDLSLWERRRRARKEGGMLLVSVHHNAVGQGCNPYGVEETSTYFYQPFSRELAGKVQEEMVRRLGLGDDGFYYANFAVLRETWMPAFLVECSYLIHPRRELELLEGDLVEKEAHALEKGIVAALREFHRGGTRRRGFLQLLGFNKKEEPPWE